MGMGIDCGRVVKHGGYTRDKGLSVGGWTDIKCGWIHWVKCGWIDWRRGVKCGWRRGVKCGWIKRGR